MPIYVCRICVCTHVQYVRAHVHNTCTYGYLGLEIVFFMPEQTSRKQNKISKTFAHTLIEASNEPMRYSRVANAAIASGSCSIRATKFSTTDAFSIFRSWKKNLFDPFSRLKKKKLVGCLERACYVRDVITTQVCCEIAAYRGEH
jgi:hypothetical protein